MFRAIILCVTACSINHPRWCRPATSWVHYTTSSNTQSSVPEEGHNDCPKHVELTGIINKPLLLHLVGCLYYLYCIIFFWDLLNNLNLTISWKRGEYGEILIMPANGRWDLIRRLKVKLQVSGNHLSTWFRKNNSDLCSGDKWSDSLPCSDSWCLWSFLLPSDK